MKIINLQAENVKRLVAVSITPQGNMVEITGKNGQGKTSVLDSIWWALAGLANVQGKPIREGATEARIRLDLGDIIVTREWDQRMDGTRSTLKVVAADGTPIKSPQTMLEGLFGALTFDPLHFTRLSGKEQFDALKIFVPGVDFEKIEADNKADFEERTVLNRQAKSERAAADAIKMVDLPEGEVVDEDALINQLAEASKVNADIELRRANRLKMVNRAQENRKKIEELEQQIQVLDEEATNLEDKLAKAGPLAELVDVRHIQAKLETAKNHRQAYDSQKQKQERTKAAIELEAKADALSKRIAQRDQAKLEAISKANLPVEGITFGSGVILLDGVPFNQASDAQQLRASIAIAMASNPKLKVIRVRDGSLLDEDSMKLLAEMADKHDYQVWIERVDSSGEVGFVIEDGHVKGHKVKPNEDVSVKLPPNVKIDEQKFKEDVKHDRKPKGEPPGVKAAAAAPTIDIENNGEIKESSSAPEKKESPYVRKIAKPTPKPHTETTQSDEDII